jgi:hypothetical protein
MEMGGNGWLEPEASNVHLAGPLGGGHDHPFLSGGIAHHVIHCLGIGRLPTAAEEKAIAAVQDVKATVSGQEG